jgi:hypothetical protein
MSNKRKRQYDDDEKLEHQCMKEINREVKKMKTFVMQKAVKSLAKWKAKLEEDSTKEELNERIRKCVEEIDALKRVEVKELVMRAARSIGLRPKELETMDVSPFGLDAVDILTAMKKRVLETQRLVKALEPLEQKVTFRRQEKLCIEDGGSLKKLLRRQRKVAGKKANMDPMRAARATENAVFCDSLSGGVVEFEEEEEHDDFAALNKNEKGWEKEDSFAVKKNRPGQRARQKRHEEEEVRKQKKAGTWVPPKEIAGVDKSRTDLRRPREEGGKGGKGGQGGKGGKGKGSKGGGKGGGKDGGKGKGGGGGGGWSGGGKGGGKGGGGGDDDGPSHASWAAKNAQKAKQQSAISAGGTGKKITFD